MCPLTLSLTDALFSKQCCTIIRYPSFKYLRSRRDCVSAKKALSYPTNSQFYNSICIKLAFFIFTKMLYNIYFEFLLKRQSFTVDRSHFNKKKCCTLCVHVKFFKNTIIYAGRYPPIIAHGTLIRQWYNNPDGITLWRAP